jgi:LPXTG-site transpeptidase (sortase) family protein
VAAPAPTATAIPPTATPVPRAGQPTRVKIPVIRVDAAVEYVGLTPEGAMDVPKDYSQTAWYEPGPRPGEQGNAAIAGHVDSKTGKAVFWDLAKLKPGDEVFIVGDDGAERRFVVTGVQSYGRTDAPLQEIFGPTTSRRLNLITCDSTSNFDRKTGEYAANVVVYTELAP